MACSGMHDQGMATYTTTIVWWLHVASAGQWVSALSLFVCGLTHLVVPLTVKSKRIINFVGVFTSSSKRPNKNVEPLLVLTQKLLKSNSKVNQR